ncbi:hypothetical protein FRC03_002471 [Tulasnella sp. 419]|nr:hypothetical protein FRC03_002471 [Tulasnella sp. 419]
MKVPIILSLLALYVLSVIAGRPGRYLGDDTKRIYARTTNHHIEVENPDHIETSPPLRSIRSNMDNLVCYYAFCGANWNNVQNLVIKLRIILNEGRPKPEVKAASEFNNVEDFSLGLLFQKLIEDLQYLPNIPTHLKMIFTRIEIQLYKEFQKEKDACDKRFERSWTLDKILEYPEKVVDYCSGVYKNLLSSRDIPRSYQNSPDMEDDHDNSAV